MNKSHGPKGKNFKCLCGSCPKIYSSPNGMWLHLKRDHKEKMKEGVTYKLTVSKSNFTSKKIIDTRKKNGTDKSPRVQLPQINYIDIPVTIRIPITLGQVEILETG